MNQTNDSPPGQPAQNPDTQQPNISPQKKSRGGWLLFIIILAAMGVILLWEQSRKVKINWTEDYDAALKLAQQQNKPLLIAFHSHLAELSILIRQTTYQRPRFTRVAKDFVTVSLSLDKHPKLFKQHDISTYPTHIIKQPDGARIAIVIGYRTDVQFEGILKNALQEFNSTAQQPQ